MGTTYTIAAMGWRHSAATALNVTGVARLIEAWYGRSRLTVLAYHRIVDHTASGFVGFAGNVSASPEAFAAQMDLVGRRFNPVSIGDVAESLDGGRLPDRPLLVTFDDGYRDNHDHALSILADRSIPAVVFLAADHVGSVEPFWWDLVAWAFQTSRRSGGHLPLLGNRTWDDPHRIAAEWIRDAKQCDERGKQEAVVALTGILETPHAGSTFAEAHLTWDHVRAMQRRGIDFGAHTCSHPILTRVDRDRAGREITESVTKVGRETGVMPVGFAYPNGLEGDYDESTVAMLADAGIRLGFTLSPGPVRRRELVDNPLEIPRVYVHHTDTTAALAVKASGALRLLR